MQQPDRKWLPVDWMDEAPPQTGVSPDAFLRRHPDTGAMQLWPIDAAGYEADSLAAMAHDLTDGDVVAFFWTEERGAASVMIDDDGTWTVEPPFPDDTNSFDLVDGEYGVMQTLGDLVKEARLDFPHERMFDVVGWVWSDDIAFRLSISDGGAAHFVQVPAVTP